MMKITWQMPTPLLMYRAFTGVMSGFNFHHCLTTVSMNRLFLLKLIVLGFLESTVVDLTLDFFILLFCIMCFRVRLFGIFRNKNIFRLFRSWEQNSRNRNPGTVEPRLSGLFDYSDFFSGPVFFMNINKL